MLQRSDQNQRTERPEQPQEQGVPAGIHRIRREVGGAPQVVVGVQLEQGGRREARHHYYPQHDRQAECGGEQPVAA